VTNIEVKHKQEAIKMSIALKRMSPQARFWLASFMDFQPVSDEVMNSGCIYEACEKADVYSKTGEAQEFVLDIGLSIKSVNVRINFENIAPEGEEEDWSIKDYIILDEKKP